jgi:hypothetical protein
MLRTMIRDGFSALEKAAKTPARMVRASTHAGRNKNHESTKNESTK